MRVLDVSARRLAAVAVAVAAVVLAVASAAEAGSPRPGASRAPALASRILHHLDPPVVWPAAGQSALMRDGFGLAATRNQPVAPIASVAKVMTAFQVLAAHPLTGTDPGPTLTLTAQDVADTAADRQRDESVVSVAAGERITERQALEAVLLPSANNIARILGRWVAGSQSAFTAQMTAKAHSIGAVRTTYTDPAGLDSRTVSTAADQVMIFRLAMGNPVFAGIVALPSAVIPVAGTIHTTDWLLGQDGFIGGKTGSDNAAGGCFVFQDVRVIKGRRIVLTGAVLGQPGPQVLTAAFDASQQLTDGYVRARS